MDGKNILYSLNVNDAQDVAEQEFGIVLTDSQLERIKDRVGDHIQWYDAMTLTIQDLQNEGEIPKSGEVEIKSSFRCPWEKILDM